MMTSVSSSFPRLLTNIDELTRGDHVFLQADDTCAFLGDYTARKGFNYSATNQLIFNFKKPMDRRGKPGWQYKSKAIGEAAGALSHALAGADLTGVVFVPTPPSKTREHPLYDDRLLQTLKLIKPSIEIRELVLQISDTEADHESAKRLRPEERYALYRIDEAVADPRPREIVVFDDLLTNGSHFKAMKRILQERYPEIPVWGLFLARRVPAAIDLNAFDDIGF